MIAETECVLTPTGHLLRSLAELALEGRLPRLEGFAQGTGQPSGVAHRRSGTLKGSGPSADPGRGGRVAPWPACLLACLARMATGGVGTASRGSGPAAAAGKATG